MANYNTFKNVKTVTAAGVSITCPTSVTYEFDDAFIEDACDGAVYPTKQAYGARMRTFTVTGRDAITLYSALGASGSCSFTLQDGEGGADTVYSLGTGKGTSYSFGSGETGDLGSGSITVMLTGEPA